MLYQVIATQFIVVKNTWPSTLLLTVGAVSNIALNYWLIPLLGVEGAGVATLLGYVLTVFSASVVLVRMRLLIVRVRFLVSVCVMVIYFIIWRCWFINALGVGLLLSVLGTMIMLIFYRYEVGQLIRR